MVRPEIEAIEEECGLLAKITSGFGLTQNTRKRVEIIYSERTGDKLVPIPRILGSPELVEESVHLYKFRDPTGCLLAYPLWTKEQRIDFSETFFGLPTDGDLVAERFDACLVVKFDSYPLWLQKVVKDERTRAEITTKLLECDGSEKKPQKRTEEDLGVDELTRQMMKTRLGDSRPTRQPNQTVRAYDRLERNKKRAMRKAIYAYQPTDREGDFFLMGVWPNKERLFCTKETRERRGEFMFNGDEVDLMYAPAIRQTLDEQVGKMASARAAAAEQERRVVEMNDADMEDQKPRDDSRVK